MTDDRTVVSEVEVAVDPGTAFRVFTDEVDLWWVRGPINFSGDGGRVFAVRIEPGVGGRLLQVYDAAEGEEYVQGRITAWEPGVRVAWSSAVDDVSTEVRFAATDVGTRVTIEARIPAGGVDRGGSSWTRVVPNWLPRWVARRDRLPHEQRDIARLALGVSYARPATAARWLADVFGFEPLGGLPTSDEPHTAGEYRDPWIEFHIGNSSLMVFRLAPGVAVGGGPAFVPWVYVDDVEAHLAHAEASGAKILAHHEWPWLATYVAKDLEGNRWTFAQARPTQR